MELLNFLNKHKGKDGIGYLQMTPYSLTVKQDGEYFLFKYNQFDSDFSEKIVREARGSIFRIDENGKWICVCRPFDKFFNYGEPWADEIDWSTAVVEEKIDGSLMKMWYDKGEWHLSTNGTIDAFKCFQDEGVMSFGVIFERALGRPIEQLSWFLNKEWTYMFELTSPETRVVVPYGDGVYFLAARDNKTGEYHYELPFVYIHENKMNLYAPNASTGLRSLEDVIATAQKLDHLHEGFVVCVGYGRRIKVKSPEYLRAAHLAMKGFVEKSDIVEMMKAGVLDDFLAYFPDYAPMVAGVISDKTFFLGFLGFCWDVYGKLETRKEFAMQVGKMKGANLMFRKYTDPSLSFADMFNALPPSKQSYLLGYKEN